MRTKTAATSATPTGPQAPPASAATAGRRGLPAALWTAIFFILPLACEATTRAVGIPLPGGVSGFVVLLAVLAWRGAPSPEVSALAQGLIRWLPAIVVAPMVGIFAGNALRAGEWLAIACGVTAGIIVSQVVTGLVMLCLLHRRPSRGTDAFPALAPSVASPESIDAAQPGSPPGATTPPTEARPRLAIVSRSV